jgi:outer membrane protein assembly factor BamA
MLPKLSKLATPCTRTSVRRWSIAVIAAIASPAAADCPHDEQTKIIPLPVWSTSPNTGTTWGFMPVFIRVCPDDGHTQWVLAPSVTHNAIIHTTGTIRFFDYPDADTTMSLIAGASTRINYRVVGKRLRTPTETGAFTDDTYLRFERDAFARFFGLGMDSRESGESTYTAETERASERRGLNIGNDLNLGVEVGFDREAVLAMGVKNLPLATEAYPTVPGMTDPSLVIWQGIDLRYDDRVGGDYADRGMRVEAGLAVVEGLVGSPSFVRGSVQGRWLIPELTWLAGAARFAYSGMSARSAPFYQQSTLGGGYLMRGFAEGRFYATQAWTAEFEQRIRVLRTSLFNVTTDWRIDPFVAVGQVFDDVRDVVANPQVSVGAGIRIFVHPNIVGRIDFAEAGEGIKIYVEIGYPY